MFFTVQGLENVAWPRQCQQFDLDIRIRGISPQDHNLRKDNFCLHCAPAVNLFEQNSEPVHLDHRRTSYHVIADVGARDGVQVYSLDRVVGLDSESGQRNEYFPMYTFQHRQKGGRYYHSHRRTLGTGRPETYLSVGGGNELRPESLSCSITATNGGYPRRYLRENSISTPSVDFPSYASFKNLTRPSRMLEPPERKRFQWDLISHLSLNYSSLTSLDVLKRLLNLYDWTDDEQNRRRIDGLKKINVESVERVRKGALMRGLEIQLTVHEDSFRSTSDIHLFGMVLHHFFSMYASVNCFVKTRMICHPSNKELTWEPLLGENSPI
jgi:type VI secretion system protein ImpG